MKMEGPACFSRFQRPLRQASLDSECSEKWSCFFYGSIIEIRNYNGFEMQVVFALIELLLFEYFYKLPRTLYESIPSLQSIGRTMPE